MSNFTTIITQEGSILEVSPAGIYVGFNANGTPVHGSMVTSDETVASFHNKPMLQVIQDKIAQLKDIENTLVNDLQDNF